MSHPAYDAFIVSGGIYDVLSPDTSSSEITAKPNDQYGTHLLWMLSYSSCAAFLIMYIMYISTISFIDCDKTVYLYAVLPYRITNYAMVTNYKQPPTACPFMC